MSITRSILKATDGSLRTDNWQYILDVCDRVREDPEDGGEEAIEVIEERLEQKDANVILRTLTLIISLAENCGSRLKQLISSKHFTRKLFSLIESKSVHIIVKREIAKMVKQLSLSFKDDPSLRYMGDLLSQIVASNPNLVDGDQPNVPSKQKMSTESKLKEDQEFEEALKLSLAEYEQQQQQKQQHQQLKPQEFGMNLTGHTGQPTQTSLGHEDLEPLAPAVIKKVRAMYDLSSTEPDELSFRKGDVIVVLEQVYRDWWRGTLSGKVGIFPLNYVTPIEEPSLQEREAEKTKEDSLFAQKPNIDQLYHILENSKATGNSDLTQNPAINDLYGSVTPLRPQVAKSIGKYARKREDLASLRQVLATAEATYNQLLDRATKAYTSSVPPQYGPLPTNGPVQAAYGREVSSANYYNTTSSQPAVRSTFSQPNHAQPQPQTQPQIQPQQTTHFTQDRYQGQYTQQN